MEYSKQTVIEGLKRTIEPCVKSLAFSRSEERDLLKKESEKLEEENKGVGR